MKKLDVQITKAEIESFAVEFKSDLPEVTATVALFTSNDKKVTTFTISSGRWSQVKFDVPVGMIPAIKDIGNQLEAIVTIECNKQMIMIENKE